MKYLLDTNICIYYFKGLHKLDEKLNEKGFSHCAISEITVAELKYGLEKSIKKEENKKVIEDFISEITIIPIISSFDIYAKEKVRLQKEGKIIDDFDLPIGSTAIANNMILVTGNIKHFERLNNIKLENWIE